MCKSYTNIFIPAEARYRRALERIAKLRDAGFGSVECPTMASLVMAMEAIAKEALREADAG